MSALYTTQELIDAISTAHDHAYHAGDKALAWEYAFILADLHADRTLEEVQQKLAEGIERLNKEPMDYSTIIRAKQEAGEYLSTFLIRTVDAR